MPRDLLPYNNGDQRMEINESLVSSRLGLYIEVLYDWKLSLLL